MVLYRYERHYDRRKWIKWYNIYGEQLEYSSYFLKYPNTGFVQNSSYTGFYVKSIMHIVFRDMHYQNRSIKKPCNK